MGKRVEVDLEHFQNAFNELNTALREFEPIFNSAFSHLRVAFHELLESANVVNEEQQSKEENDNDNPNTEPNSGSESVTNPDSGSKPNATSWTKYTNSNGLRGK